MANINLGGSISTTGTSILGNASVVFSSDADHTLSVAEYTNNFLEVTSSVSLTGTRNLFAPLVQGQSFIVQNNTTGGQSIQVIGVSGSGVTIAGATTQSVTCDGTNYLVPVVTSGGSSSVPWQGTIITTPVFTLSAARDQRWLVDSSSNNVIVKAPTPGGGALDGDTFTLHWISTSGTNTVGVDGVASGFKVEDASNPGQAGLIFTGTFLPSLGCTVTWEWRSLNSVWYLLSNSTILPPFATYDLGPFSGSNFTPNTSGLIVFTGTLAGNVLLLLNPLSPITSEWTLDFTSVNLAGNTIDISPAIGSVLLWGTIDGTNQVNLYRIVYTPTGSPTPGVLFGTALFPSLAGIPTTAP